MHRTRLGNVALACAAIDDVLARTLRAVAVSIVGAGTGASRLLLLAVPYLIVPTAVVREAVARTAR
ncbi:hypothetical protein [Pseudosporangium ferrugineum]|uniref:Uncharacterized protein n=1 Tax=Pseudosporangium ferrugineum TaxID=439699 RepID=A0A2T0SB37_9ACTN|nr:hypothetical protein [Pseudosporangium ferrugineum]PRY30591.1 hypothetical protein CLV70_104143 [Pseudosporangium ferrugineum]